MVQAQWAFLVTDTHRLQPRQAVESNIQVAVLSVVRISELHLNLVVHVGLDLALHTKPHTTPDQAVLRIAIPIEVVHVIIDFGKCPGIAVDTTGNRHGRTRRSVRDKIFVNLRLQIDPVVLQAFQPLLERPNIFGIDESSRCLLKDGLVVIESAGFGRNDEFGFQFLDPGFGRFEPLHQSVEFLRRHADFFSDGRAGES